MPPDPENDSDPCGNCDGTASCANWSALTCLTSCPDCRIDVGKHAASEALAHAQQHLGMLVCGSSGSGKTTILLALLKHLSQLPDPAMRPGAPSLIKLSSSDQKLLDELPPSAFSDDALLGPLRKKWWKKCRACKSGIL